jgi:hypothetical protein
MLCYVNDIRAALMIEAVPDQHTMSQSSVRSLNTTFQ